MLRLAVPRHLREGPFPEQASSTVPKCHATGRPRRPTLEHIEHRSRPSARGVVRIVNIYRAQLARDLGDRRTSRGLALWRAGIVFGDGQAARDERARSAIEPPMPARQARDIENRHGKCLIADEA